MLKFGIEMSCICIIDFFASTVTCMCIGYLAIRFVSFWWNRKAEKMYCCYNLHVLSCEKAGRRINEMLQLSTNEWQCHSSSSSTSSTNNLVVIALQYRMRQFQWNLARCVHNVMPVLSHLTMTDCVQSTCQAITYILRLMQSLEKQIQIEFHFGITISRHV